MTNSSTAYLWYTSFTETHLNHQSTLSKFKQFINLDFIQTHFDPTRSRLYTYYYQYYCMHPNKQNLNLPHKQSKSVPPLLGQNRQHPIAGQTQ